MRKAEGQDVVEVVGELADIFRSGGNVGLRLVDLGVSQAEVGGGGRHDLHQSAGAYPRACLRVESRLLITLRSEQSPVPASRRGIFLEQRIKA